MGNRWIAINSNVLCFFIEIYCFNNHSINLKTNLSIGWNNKQLTCIVIFLLVQKNTALGINMSFTLKIKIFEQIDVH